MSVPEQRGPGVSVAVNGLCLGALSAFEVNADCRVRSDLIDKGISVLLTSARTLQMIFLPEFTPMTFQ